jgi:glutamyl-tRNA synthetase
LVVEAFRERAETLRHMAESARYCYEDFETPDPAAARKHLRPVVLEPLRAIRQRLAGLDHWGEAEISDVIKDVAADFELGLGKIWQPIRVAVTGGPVSPPIDVTVRLIGRERTLKRLQDAIRLVEARASTTV